MKTDTSNRRSDSSRATAAMVVEPGVMASLTGQGRRQVLEAQEFFESLVVNRAALALGAALTPSEDLLEALFGAAQKLSLGGLLLGLAAAIGVVLAVLGFKDRLTLTVFSPELAAATGLQVDRIELYFLLVFTVTILIGLRFMGALLSSALIILPAATARQLTSELSRFMVVSMALSVLSVLAGSLLNAFVLRASTAAPAIVITSAVLFALSLLRRAR